MAGYMTSRQYSTWQIYRSLLFEARPFWSFIAAVFALGDEIKAFFTSVGTELKAKKPG